jgi:hypothetical protein
VVSRSGDSSGPHARTRIDVCSHHGEGLAITASPADTRRSCMNRNMLLRLELLVVLAMVSAGCQAVEGIFKAGMWAGILLVVVVVGILFMLFGRARS